MEKGTTLVTVMIAAILVGCTTHRAQQVKTTWDPTILGDREGRSKAMFDARAKRIDTPLIPGVAIYMVHGFAARGDDFPVNDQAGNRIFSVSLVDGTDSRVTLRVEIDDERKEEVTLDRDEQHVINLGGIDYSIGFPTRWTSPGSERISKWAGIVITWTVQEKGANKDLNRTGDTLRASPAG